MMVPAQTSGNLATTLPGHYYHDPDIYKQELKKIFADMWVCVGRAEDLPLPGSYRVVSLDQESILLVRNREGALQAFFNVCRHRGVRLCAQESGQLKGAVQCRYHAWTYGLDGKLLGVPNMLHQEKFERSAYGLYPVALTVWEGLIWLCLDDNPVEPMQQLHAPILERFGSYAPFARYQLGTLRLGKTLTYEVKANWKLLVENFMECYHCGPLHPEFCDLLPGFRSGQIYELGEAALLAETAEAFTITAKASRPPLPLLLPEEQRNYYGIVLLPNVFLNLLPDHVVVHTLWPQNEGHTRIVCDWLFDPDAMKEERFNPMDAVEIFDLVNRQDWEICELTQPSMASRAYEAGGIYTPSEQHIAVFRDFILERLS